MQETWTGLIDAHCHLCDDRILPALDLEVEEAIEAGSTGFVSSALTREEFEWVELTRFHKYHNYFLWSAGIHPNYEKSSDKDLDRLIKLCDQKSIAAIGEIGLDGRNYNDEWQLDILLKQLDIARNYDLPVIFHVVYKFYDLYKILDRNFPRIRGYLHGFNNSLDVAEQFSKFDLGFSLGCRPPKPQVIKFLVKHGYILFETDAPFQKAKNDKESINHLKNLQTVAQNISNISGISENKLIEMQKRSFHRIFPRNKNGNK